MSATSACQTESIEVQIQDGDDELITFMIMVNLMVNGESDG